MMSFKEYIISNEAIELHYEDEMSEGVLRTVGRVAIIAKIRSLSVKIKKAKSVEAKLDLLASQNTYLAAINLANE